MDDQDAIPIELEDLPDPTPSEARALIVGAGLFWVSIGLATTLARIDQGLAIPFVAVGFASILWLVFGGVGHVAWRLGDRRGQQGVGLRAGTPRYLRRAARVLGWPERVVLGVLAVLLVIDIILVAVGAATSPDCCRF